MQLPWTAPPFWRNIHVSNTREFHAHGAIKPTGSWSFLCEFARNPCRLNKWIERGENSHTLDWKNDVPCKVLTMRPEKKKKTKLCDLMELWDDLMSMRIFLFLCFCFSSATNMYILSPKNRACLYFVARNIQVSSQVKRFPESSWLLSLMVYTF